MSNSLNRLPLEHRRLVDLLGWISLATSVVLVTSCTTWKLQTKSPETLLRDGTPSRVRLTLSNRERVTVYAPAVADDRLVGGTPSGDEAEYRGLAAVFRRRLPEIPVTSLKSTIGHCLGASGAVEIVATILALNNRIVPATLGTTDIDPAFELYSVALHRMAWATASALVLAESFGGRCAALLLRAP
jgi:hypothetical protein